MRIANIISNNSYKQVFTGRDFKEDKNIFDKEASEVLHNNGNAAYNPCEALETSTRYLEEGEKFFNLAYDQYKDAEKILQRTLKFAQWQNITCNAPIKKTFNDKNRAELYSCIAGYAPENYIYDNVIEIYNEDKSLKRKIEFSRVPANGGSSWHKIQEYTDELFVKSIKEYDNNGNLKRIIRGNSDNGDEIDTIELYNKDGSKKAQINYFNGRVINYQKGDFLTNGNLLRCPLTFLFNKNGRLTEVQKNITYEGYHIINGETFKFDNGVYCGYEKHVLSADE